jgi:signal transduction histidine kinase
LRESPEVTGLKTLPTRIRWHESWILRGSFVAALIVAAAFGTSLWFTADFLTGVARTTHMPEVERVLDASVANLRELHTTRQELVVSKLRALWSKHGTIPPESEGVLAWLKESGAEGLADLGGVRIVAYAGDEGFGEPPTSAGESDTLVWLDRSHLRMGPHLVEFPPGAIYEEFQESEDVRKRYRLIGIAMQEKVLTQQLRLQTGIGAAAFLVLVIVFWRLARGFQKSVRTIVEGFATWADRDSAFRFDSSWKGELALVTAHFNRMADEVESNRQKTLYLEKIASWQVIARKLAHEIKNPLTPIQMMVSQLKRRYRGDDPEFSKLLTDAQTIVTEEVAGLRRMVDNFSNFARLPQPVPARVDLVELSRQIIELERAAYGKARIELRSPDTNGSGEPAEVFAMVDDQLMRQVLINLIKNAVEASGEDQAKIEVTVEQNRSGPVITVTDNGPGIPEEILSRLFEAYVTTKHTGPTPGMGLGLAICQKIVIDHGGHIRVESTPGRTSFRIMLPRLVQGSST